METSKNKRLMDKSAIERSIDKLAIEINENFPDGRLNEVALLGIQLRGVYIAERIKKRIGEITGKFPWIGTIDISMYRDDIGMRKTLPKIHETEIPFDVNDKHIVLVDDVLWTGRTIRAALDAITDFGRPKTIRLAALIDRKGREFPIHAEYVGMKCDIENYNRVYVSLIECDGKDSVYVNSLRDE